MDPSRQLEIISERFIKPSSPTPPSLRSYKLSYYDQIAPNIYIPLAFFYPNIEGSDWLPASEISQVLQLSLSKTLTYYYPFAGRLTNNLFIDCNDMGLQYIEARIKCRMLEMIRQPTSHLQHLIFPAASETVNVPFDSSLVIVQLNYLECGSLVVSVLISHKIADASTISTFMNDWSAIARQSNEDDHHIPSPQFIGASLFPPDEDHAAGTNGMTMPMTESGVTRRFLFTASKIDELKAMAATSGVDNPTRVQVVTALLYKCLMSVSRPEHSGLSRPYMLLNAVNLRPITTPPLPQSCVGNLASGYSVILNEEDELKFPEFASKIRNGLKKFRDEYKEKNDLGPKQSISVFLASLDGMCKNFDVYRFTSWCRFPFYEVDFGWGRPSLVSCATNRGPTNGFVLMDVIHGDGSTGNGIQAVITLEKPHMCLFEANEELLAFASNIQG